MTYRCDNGIIVLHPQESEIVKRICKAYLDGQSLLTIATWLNEEQIEYMPEVIGWNKARLKRIIEDERYLGKEPYSKEFKAEALKLSDELGMKKAAAQLGLPYYTLADWRNNRKHAEPEPELSEVELKIRNRELERENAELRVANEILKDALGFFAKDRKK